MSDLFLMRIVLTIFFLLVCVNKTSLLREPIKQLNKETVNLRL